MPKLENIPVQKQQEKPGHLPFLEAKDFYGLR